jgi:O-antigen/teichoic acid export membrane protein
VISIHSLIKNFLYVFISNLVSLIISLLVLLVIPKFIGVESYGYWQLYVFYTTLIGFLHFGFNDGLYLRLGGEKYSDLNGSLYFSLFYILLISQLIIASVVFLILFFISISPEKEYVILMTALCMIVVNVRYMLLFLLQATNRIKAYSLITISDRLVYLLIVFFLVFFREQSFKFYIWADFIGKTISLILAFISCKELMFRNFNEFYYRNALKEFIVNIRVGIKLMLSNVAGKLVVGNVRFGIEAVWSVVIFGKISLMLSVTSFLMIFINSISLVLFPYLRRVDPEKLSSIYLFFRGSLSIFFIFVLLFYYPIYMVLEFWLPAYKDIFPYLYIVFPIVVFEGKMALLVSTYLKVLREERLLLKVNIWVVVLSFVITGVIVLLFKNLEFAMYSILFLISSRVLIFELYLEKILKISLLRNIIFEYFIVFMFLFINKSMSFDNSLTIYSVLIILLLFLKRSEVLNIFYIIKRRLYNQVL